MRPRARDMIAIMITTLLMQLIMIMTYNGLGTVEAKRYRSTNVWIYMEDPERPVDHEAGVAIDYDGMRAEGWAGIECVNTCSGTAYSLRCNPCM